MKESEANDKKTFDNQQGNAPLAGVVSSAASKDYNRLHEIISKGFQVPCFVDHEMTMDTYRDVAKVKMINERYILIGCRGIQYGGVESWYDGEPKKAFMDECKRLNLEYYW